MAKRSSLFGTAGTAVKAAPSTEAAPPPPAPAAERRYPVAKTREGKRVATAYLDPEALKALQRVAIDEDCTLQDLLVEGINAVFEKRGMSRIA